MRGSLLEADARKPQKRRAAMNVANAILPPSAAKWETMTCLIHKIPAFATLGNNVRIFVSVEKKEWPYLKHAPIVEALFDMRVSLQPGFKASAFRQVLEILKDTYPIAEEIHAVALKGALNLSASTLNQEVADEVIGFRLKNSKGTRLVQFRLDGFTFNHLKPYPKWKELFTEAWKHWELYLKIAEPIGVTRIALRYINREEFPSGEALSAYIKNLPALDPAIPAEPVAFLFQEQVRLAGIDDTSAMVVQFTEPSAPQRGIVYVLDIDASKKGDFIPSDAERFKNYFDELRSFKNEIFFNTVTGKAIELWKS